MVNRSFYHISTALALVGLLVAIGSTIVLALAQDAGSFIAAFIGLALIALGGLGYKISGAWLA